MTLALEALFIFLCRVVDVSLGTVRMLLLFRGKRAQASVVGFFEVLVFINALGRVVNNLDSPLKLLAYAAGFATGNYVGSRLDERLALGYQTVHVVLPREHADRLTCRLRDAGFGATVVSATGREGERSMVMVTLQRKSLPCALAMIEDEAPDAFVTILDTRHRRGGVFVHR